MSTSTPQAPSSSTSLAQLRQQQYESAKKYTSIGIFVACPIIALLPPRKLDFYTFGLSAIWIASANHVVKAQTGRSIWQRLTTPSEEPIPTDRYREMQKKLREAKGLPPLEKQKGALEKLWKGDEGDDWKEKRLQKEQELLDNGEGYGTLIMDQIKEVWSGKNKVQDKGSDAKSGSREVKSES